MTRISSHAFITELDGYFSNGDLAGAGGCLERWLKKAVLQEDKQGELTVINEYLGYTRRINDEEGGIACVNRALELIDTLEIADTVAAATIFLNAATTLKCFSQPQRAMGIYQKALKIYEASLPKNDPLFAGLFNNMALAMQDVGDLDGAEESFKKAIEINKINSGKELETAVSLVNLAHFYYSLNIEDERIEGLMTGALAILDDPENFGKKDYAFHCKKCAPSFGFFGYFFDEKRLNERADEIYAGS